jgi:hypothetical protein
VNGLLEQRGVERPQRRRLLTVGVLRDMQARPTPSGPKSPPLPDWAADRIRELSDRRVADLEALAGRGVRLIGDPGLMRMPAEVPTAAPPLPTPSIDLLVAAETLASALTALSGDSSDDARDEPDDEDGSEPASE